MSYLRKLQKAKTNAEDLENVEGNFPDLSKNSKRADEHGKGVTFDYTQFFISSSFINNYRARF